MKRICYVIPSLSVGGTERQLTYLLRGLTHDYDLMVVCTHHDGALAGEARRAGAIVHVLGTRGGWDPMLYLRLHDFLRNHRPDVLHTFLFGFDYLANRAARATGVPVIISTRRELATWRKWRHVYFQRMGNALVDCIVANSQSVADFAAQQERAPANLFRVIPNGIQTDDFVSTRDTRQIRLQYRIPFNRHIIGIVANFSSVKDHALFVDTAIELIRRRADVHFLMVGGGPLVGSVHRKVKRAGIEDFFTRVHTVVEVPDLYALMDVSVLCSKVEGFPNVLIESMSTGTPVVAAAVGGIPELVRHGETGRLVSTRSPVDFANEIEWVLSHPPEVDLMTRCAGEFVRAELSVEKMVDRYRQLYADLLAEKAGKGR